MRRTALLSFVLTACGGSAPLDAGFDAFVPDACDCDAAAFTDAGPDAMVRPDAGPDVETVDVSHAREVRGVWIASVYNINWPSRSGLSGDAQRAELDHLLDVAAGAGMNAVFLQIRAESDAFYASALEP
ncbi:MAG: family 10 glycosylhydrolase [Sandaracinaceae bacterium]